MGSLSKISIVDVKKFLSTKDKPVETKEFREFWESCTEAEKEQFKDEIMKHSANEAA